MKLGRVVGALIAATLWPCWPAFARADGTTTTAVGADLPAAHGQQALSVKAWVGGIVAQACSTAPCSLDGGASINVAASAGLEKAKLRVIELANGRKVVRIDVPDDAGVEEILLAAPPVGEPAKPIVFWNQKSAAVHRVIVEEPLARGVRVLIGTVTDDFTLCGRPVVVAAQALDPSTLAFEKGASVQSLPERERSGAPKLAATRIEAPSAAPLVRVLRETGSSSAVDRKVGALSDGDLDTSWSEAKTGDGGGEFVKFSSQVEVPIEALEIAVRPSKDVPKGAAPKTFFVATDDRVLAVTMPEDAWKRPPHTRYLVKLPEPLRTSCLAIVLDTSFGSGDKLTATTLSEVTARTPFDAIDFDALAATLASGGERAAAAGAVLERGGHLAEVATEAVYPKLGDAGHELAWRVIDAATCDEQAAFYGSLFAAATARTPSKSGAPGEVDPELAHARDRLRVCKSASAPALAKLLGVANDRTRVAAASELAQVSPAEAVPLLLDAIGTAKAEHRSYLIAALSVAARSSRAKNAVEVELEGFARRSPATGIALLRALGPVLRETRRSEDAFATAARAAKEFDARYLLVGPAAELASAGSAPALEYLRAALARDADPHMRRRAADASGRVGALRPELLRAIDDADPRVREGAIEAIGKGATSNDAAVPLVRRLASDDWTFVRVAAAGALAATPPAPIIDDALANALVTDLSPEVRERVIDALSAHKATNYLRAVREVALGDVELLDVRAHAVAALGEMCDRSSIDGLTKLAVRSGAPFDDIGRRLGPPSIVALGAMHPKDLEARLAPLLAKDATGPAREMARAAISAQPSCP